MKAMLFFLFKIAAAVGALGLAAIAAYFGGNIIAGIILSGTWITGVLSVVLRPEVMTVFVETVFWLARAAVFGLLSIFVVGIFTMKEDEVPSSNNNPSRQTRRKLPTIEKYNYAVSKATVLDPNRDSILWRKQAESGNLQDTNGPPAKNWTTPAIERSIRRETALEKAAHDPRMSKLGKQTVLIALRHQRVITRFLRLATPPSRRREF